jgi:hypothetical protein
MRRTRRSNAARGMKLEHFAASDVGDALSPEDLDQ